MSDQNISGIEVKQAATSLKKLCRTIVQKIKLIDDHQDNSNDQKDQKDQAVGIAVFVYMRQNQKKLKQKYPSIDQNEITANLYRKWKKLHETEKVKYLQKVRSQNLNKKSKKKRKQEKRREKNYDDATNEGIHELKEQNNQIKQQLKFGLKQEICKEASQTQELVEKNKERRMDQFVIKNTEYSGVQSILTSSVEQRDIDLIKQDGRTEQAECQVSFKIDMEIIKVQGQGNQKIQQDFIVKIEK